MTEEKTTNITTKLEIINTDESTEAKYTKASVDVCPECGCDMLMRVSHCLTCPICGWSACENL